MPIIPCTGQSQAHGRNRWFRLAEAELTTHNHGPAAEARLCLDLYSRRRGQHAPSLPVALEDPMSRYVIAPHAAHHQVIVGWDPPMQTLFGQVFDTTVEEDDADRQVAAWLIRRPGCLPPRPDTARHRQGLPRA